MVGMDDTEPKKPVDIVGKLPKGVIITVMGEAGISESLDSGSVNVFAEMIRLLKAYPEIKVQQETVALCSLLHDVCKIGCYKESTRNVKENGVWVQKPYYSWEEDMKFGEHGSKSVFLVQRYMKLTDEEAVAINCHMGMSDVVSNNVISDAYKVYPFAWLLHVADESACYIRESINN